MSSPVRFRNPIRFGPSKTETIATGVLTFTRSHTLVGTQAAAASDDLDTLTFSGTVGTGQLLLLSPLSAAQDVTLKHGTGNIICPGGADLAFTDKDAVALLVYDGDNWIVLSFTDTAGGASVLQLPDGGAIQFGAGDDVTFTHDGTTGLDIVVTQNDSGALTIADAAKTYITVDTTTGTELVSLGENVRIVDSKVLSFGAGDDVTMTHDGTTGLDIAVTAGDSGALTIAASSVNYLVVDTTSAAERVLIGKPLDLSQGQMRSNRTEYFEDFTEAAGTTLPTRLGKVIVGAGPPTGNYTSNAANGEYIFTTEGTDQLQSVTIGGDELYYDSTKNIIFEARIKITPAGANFTADERVVCGMAAARNATLDSNAAHAWFRFQGADLNIYVESDDGATDTDLQDSTIDYAKGVYMVLRIDMSNLADIKFYVDGTEQAGAAMNASAMTGNLQPYLEHQRDAGTEVNTVTIDYWQVVCDR